VLLLTLSLSACTSGSARPPATAIPTAGRPTTAVASPRPSATPDPTGGVVPADPNGFAGVVARSLVAVIQGGNVEFVERILGDAHSSSTCTPFPDIHVLSRAEADMEGALVRRSIRAARAHGRIDGVGHARGWMRPGVEWPGVADPLVVAVVLAVDCPEA
jgi:hypothetical protein